MGALKYLVTGLTLLYLCDGKVNEVDESRVMSVAHTSDFVPGPICPAIACILLACVPPPATTFPEKYEQFSGTVFLGTVLKRLVNVCVGSQHFYLVRVLRTFKGCPPKARRVVVELPCFANALTVGRKYIVHGDLKIRRIQRKPYYQTEGCDGVYPPVASSIRYANKRRNLEVCPADGKCLNGKALVRCFADPCQVADPCPSAVTCRSSFCGGCNAGFFDSRGILVGNC
uniref:Uncharacterized protein n=1 Tax=Compsopogon caeruleus TaxID=31354 RepID=A0A6T6CMV7_9RHOD|mmetsp:Transcript_6379/g.12722  ORF Transcript_6379/g.12722 Transcript_6379/m.12722 type:complete len:229 (+) Transcript_6379:90-776(+)|eukprot:CAMPEP_0184684028 /NCGR_PEP_ID=MMETSP0312-20130426/13515_1 /TAXON_ID=31354 /ORGANISM="Compsopogon coeruleus, Strain SAG 36.94" /LENGTH=228 /DNA_ID=CAMNT_0027136815 /DNA_START=59 /DNA_END=745 /DNA_ORIENTATION=-